MSKVEIEAICREDVHLTDIHELWYLTPGLTINNGLKKIENDTDVMDMIGLIGGMCKTIHIYVVTGNEMGPVQVREQCQLVEPSSSLPLHTESDSLASIPSIGQDFGKTTLKHPGFPSGVNLSSDDDVSEQQLPTLSSSDDGEEFKDDDDDDELFEKYVDVGVETFDAIEDRVHVRDEKEMYDSDEIGNLDGYDDDEEQKHKIRYFNPVTDLKKDIELKRGMIFQDNKAIGHSQPTTQSTGVIVHGTSQSRNPAPSTNVKFGQSQVRKSPRKNIVASKRWI